MITPGAWRRGGDFESDLESESDDFESDFESESDGEQRGLSESESESGSGRQREGCTIPLRTRTFCPYIFCPHVDTPYRREQGEEK